MSDRQPAEVFPPGEFLRDELEVRGWTQIEFAQIIGRPPRLVSEIMSGKRSVTPETAKEFAAALGTSAQYWMNLETAYQLYKAEPASERIAREAKLRERFPVREMIKRGWIEASDNIDVVETRVLEFFKITSVNDNLDFAHAARRNHGEDISILQIAWLCRVRQLASVLQVPPYSQKALHEALDVLRGMIPNPEEIRHIPKVLAECGVRLVVVEPMPGSKIDGVCLWMDGGRSPVIGLSLRLDKIDNFWFVLRHEIEHVLRGDGKEQDIIDTELQEGREDSELSEAERAADAAAGDFCVPRVKLESFIARVRPLYAEAKIVNFARANETHPGIVAGQLQYRGEIPYANFRKYIVKVRHIITSSALTDGWGHTSHFLGRH
ncbi:transcriptional regulator [Telmatospirillum sp. J64-1]|uniref:helix-turn-helix transcriptional regulator n=1 Tax=Telmatospirillum sp. J64-1 TaxID=2502183 RepID=UPI00115D4DB0|nr:transcriptional regulator [Telmatospirillum sp. J64-1]